jgi:hypothetical protein
MIRWHSVQDWLVGSYTRLFWSIALAFFAATSTNRICLLVVHTWTSANRALDGALAMNSNDGKERATTLSSQESHVGLDIRTKVGDVSGITDIFILLLPPPIKIHSFSPFFFVLKILVENFARESILSQIFAAVRNGDLNSHK